MPKQRINAVKLTWLTVISLLVIVAYQFIDVKFTNEKLFQYSMMIRTPKLITMLIAAFCIGTASIVFQSIISNRIVTPCLLGMNGLYILIHVAITYFAIDKSFVHIADAINPILAPITNLLSPGGAASRGITSKEIAFVVDLIIMGFAGSVIYGYLFKKTRYNILYVLLTGTVLATLFTSLSNTMIRVMDPNEYDQMLAELVAGFDHVNDKLIFIGIACIIITILVFRKDIKLLDVISLGKNRAISLGVDYDKTVRRLLIGVTFFITIATAMVGPISFLGLIIANLSRELFKTYKHSYLMIGSFLMGVVVLFGGQTLIEHVFGFGTQISVFINLFGGIYFLYLVLKNKGN